MKSTDALTVSDVAARSGFAPSALRFYEAQGLLSATRTSGGQRLYQRSVLRRLAFIRAARNIGLSLEEIAAALASLPETRTPTRADWARLSRGWRNRLDDQILALTQLVMADLLTAGGTIINVSSDAAVEAYAGWGGYGSSKAALDQVSAILAAEHPSLRVYALDPGDMRTELHQQAFPGEDISDRPEPDTVAPAVLRLLGQRPPSGRYRAADLLAEVNL